MPSSTIVAEVFKDRDYGGASLGLAVGDYDSEALTRSLGNDSISSLKVAPGYEITLYADAGFTGVSRIFKTDTPYVGDDNNDKTSSLRVTESIAPLQQGYPESVVFIQPPPVT